MIWRREKRFHPKATLRERYESRFGKGVWKRQWETTMQNNRNAMRGVRSGAKFKELREIYGNYGNYYLMRRFGLRMKAAAKKCTELVDKMIAEGRHMTYSRKA